MKTFSFSIFLVVLFCSSLNAQYIENAVPKSPVPVQQPQKYVENTVPAKQSIKQGDYDYPLNLAKEGIKLPATDDPTLKQLLNDPNTIFYKLPQSYQFYQPSSTVEHKNLTLGTTYVSTTEEVYGVYFSSYLPEFNANTFFPWETTIGLNHAVAKGNSPYGAINFINLPYSKPIAIINETPIKWIYPEGTTVSEVLYVKNNNTEEKYVFEIRTRTKVKNTWEPHVYRPLANRKELNKYTTESSAKKYLFLRNPQEDEVFKAEGFVEKIPDLTEQQTKEILNLPFKEVTFDLWSEISAAACSDQSFSIFPKDYSMGLLSVDSESCAQCHRQTQITVNRLIPKEPLIYNNPAKVGNIRGCDGIFTWYPFDVNSVSASPDVKQKLYLRQFDRNNKIVAMYDSLLHGEYKLTTYVQRSLAKYELPKQELVLNKLDTIDANLANLSSPDQRLAERQKICPACQKKLGENGTPIKTTINGKIVFVCEKSCETKLENLSVTKTP